VAPANASISASLAVVSLQTRKIKAARHQMKEILKCPAASHGRLLLEEQALVMAINHLLPVDRRLPTFQRIARQADRASLLTRPLAKGMLARHGPSILNASTKRSPQPVSLVSGVSAARYYGMSVELENAMAAIAEEIPDALFQPHGNTKLIGAARIALAALQQYSESHAYVVPPANLVVTLGALELYCAWQPQLRPKTTNDKSIAWLVDHLRLLCFPNDDKEEIPREALLDVIKAWKAGRPALIFDGRDPSRQMRRELLRNFQLDPSYSE
jgi:hypothetical protein